MIYCATQICLTCKRRLPLSAFEPTGGKLRPDGGRYYRHECRKCRCAQFKARSVPHYEPPPPPKPAGECIIRDCREHVSPDDKTGVLCPKHLAHFRPKCKCGCGREIGMEDRDGYRITCWWRRSPEGKATRAVYRALMREIRRKREEQAKQWKAAKKAARAAEVRDVPISTSWILSSPCPAPAFLSGSAITPGTATGQSEEGFLSGGE